MRLRGLLCSAAIGLATVAFHIPTAQAVQGYYSAKKETSDVTTTEFPPGFSPYYDPDFEEPWGLAVTHNPCYLFPSMACFGAAPPRYTIPTGTSAADAAYITQTQIEALKVIWAADRDSSVITLYNDQGAPLQSGGHDVIIVMPTSPSGIAYNPVCEPSMTVSSTGVVYSSPCKTAQPVTGTFNITANGKTAPAFLLIAGRNGKVYGWNPTVDPTYPVLLRNDSAAGADYTGLTIDPWGSTLYLADYRRGGIVAYDSALAPVLFAGANNEMVPYLLDDQMTPGFVPTNVAYINGHLYATYSKQAPASAEFEVTGPLATSTTVQAVYNGTFGHVDDFVLGSNGAFQVRRLNTPPDRLNAPWGIALAPVNFGPFAQMLLIGNFGDGYINAYDVNTGDFIGRLGESLTGDPVPSNLIFIPGLRGMAFKPMLYQGPSTTIPMKLWWAPRMFYGATLNYTLANSQEWSIFGYIRPN